ncbi:MAG: cobyrinate a,c-diamide synthase [Thiobacillaceae bacterium]|nr:cobyrinate a,c-diamide synthase [Thiobacillaceae bacterium]
MSSLYLSAAHKSSGKTTLTLGLARALRRQGLAVQTFKKGPDYIDPIWHALASGRPCYNLDFHLMTRAEILALYARHAASAGISLIEGNKGLYDGMDLEGSDSNAALAKLLAAPVVLVLDTQGMTRGVAPLLQGYQGFDPQVRLCGVILNKVAGPRHEDKLRAAIERYTDLRVVGAVPRSPHLAIEERHLGLIPGNESAEAEARIEAIADVVAGGVELDALRALAAVPAPAVADLPACVDGSGLRLAIAQDRAFGFYYAEDLDSLRAAGVELVPFDTLRDPHLPDADGLLLGGGFPEVFIEALAANRSLRADIRRAIEAGLPTYAECGGLMYLTRSLSWGERRGEMVGVIPADCSMQPRPVGRGYALLRPTGATPLAPADDSLLPAHEFHHSSLSPLPAGTGSYAYRVERGTGIDGRHDGFLYKNLLAAYCHRRGSGTRGWIAPFIQRMQAHASLRRPLRRAA